MRTGQFPSHTLADPAIHGARRATRDGSIAGVDASGGTNRRYTLGCHHHEAAAGGGRPLRTPDPPLESRRCAPSSSRERNGIHIIDLAQTVTRLDAALEFVRETVRRRRQRSSSSAPRSRPRSRSATEAERSGQHYVNNRWLGGMLTNFTTIKRRIQRLEALEARREAGEFERLTKKEASKLSEEIDEAERRARRHPPHAAPAGRAVHRRPASGDDRRGRGATAGDPDRGDDRHELRPGPHRLGHPGQRRRHPLRAADLRPRSPTRRSKRSQSARRGSTRSSSRPRRCPRSTSRRWPQTPTTPLPWPAGEALVFEPEPEEDEEEERRRARPPSRRGSRRRERTRGRRGQLSARRSGTQEDQGRN